MKNRNMKGYFKKQRFHRFTAFCLSIVCLLLCIPISTFAENPEASALLPEDAELTQPVFELKEGDLTHAQLQDLKVEDVALPEPITLAEALEKEHVNRLYAQETNLNTAIFQNRAGTKTAYVFNRPIKYVDANGNIKDKSTKITPIGLAGYSYAMVDNSFSVHFGSTATNGVLLQYNGASFSMRPGGSLLVSTPTLGEDERTVTYQNAFGANTALRYTTQLSGLKEDIILLSNVGKYSFEFLMATSEMTPQMLPNGQWCLQNANGNTVITFGEIMLYDSAGNIAFGSMSITPRTTGTYLVTVNAPVDFLQASSTVYPVYIDPSSTVNEGGGSGTYIKDYGIYSTQAYANLATTDKHYINSSYGRIIYKLTDFYDEYGLFTELEEYQIGKVTFSVYSHTSFTSSMKAYPMKVACGDTAEKWVGSTYINNYSQYNSSSATKTVTQNTKFSFDITEIARGWARYNEGMSYETYENPLNGFILIKNTAGAAYLATTEASGSANVSYVVDYGSYRGIYYIKNKASSSYFLKTYVSGETPSLICATERDYQTSFVVKYEGANKYLITPLYHMNYALYKTGTVAAKPSTLTNDYLWYIDASSISGAVVFRNCSTGNVLCYNGSTLSMVAARASSASNYTQTVWTMSRFGFGNQEYRDLKEYTATEIKNINCQGYAFMRDDSPQDYAAWVADFFNSPVVSEMDYETVKSEYAAHAYDMLLIWFTDEGYTYSFESSNFQHNGENEILNSNQYRVLLRTGVSPASYTAGSGDYHFWYQTSDGRWAQKFSTHEPYLLPYGVVPQSTNSGGWNKGNGSVDFYDSNIYSIIVTIS